jgi:hypothetical protein
LVCVFWFLTLDVPQQELYLIFLMSHLSHQWNKKLTRSNNSTLSIAIRDLSSSGLPYPSSVSIALGDTITTDMSGGTLLDQVCSNLPLLQIQFQFSQTTNNTSIARFFALTPPLGTVISLLKLSTHGDNCRADTSNKRDKFNRTQNA